MFACAREAMMRSASVSETPSERWLARLIPNSLCQRKEAVCKLHLADLVH